MSKTLQKKDTKISPKWSNIGPRTPPKRGPKSCKTGPGNPPKSDLEPRALPDPSGTPFWGGFWCPGPPPGAPGDPQIVDLGAILEAQIVAFGAFPGSNFDPKSIARRKIHSCRKISAFPGIDGSTTKSRTPFKPVSFWPAHHSAAVISAWHALGVQNGGSSQYTA